jgi:hypothetical protein
MVAVLATMVPAAAPAKPRRDAATLSVLSGGQRGPGELYFLQNGMLEPIGFATIRARSRANGRRARGTWTVHVGGGNGPTWSGDVTCLSVTRHRAVVGVAGTVAGGGTSFPFAGFVGLVDGGPPAPVPAFAPPWPYPGVFAPVDGFELRELPAGPGPATCPSPAAPLPGSEVWSLLANDVTVVDARPRKRCKRPVHRTRPEHRRDHGRRC